MTTVLIAIGLVLILEGLVYALAPSLVEDLLEAMRKLPKSGRRIIGALSVVIGLICLQLAGVF